MAEEFQSGICGGNWWMPQSKSVFMGGVVSPSYCSTGILNGCDLGAISPSSWSTMTDFVDLKTRSTISVSSCKDSDNNNSIGSHESDSMVFQNTQRPREQTDSDHSTGVSCEIFIDSTLQMMGFGLSSSSNSSSDWNLDVSGRGESYSSIIDEDMNTTGGPNTPQPQKAAWSNQNNFNTTTHEDSLLSKISNDQDFVFNNSTSYAYPSTLFQSLLEPQPQQTLINNNRSMNSSTPNYVTNLISHGSDPLKQQQNLGSMNLTNNNAPFWNASTEGNFLTAPQPQLVVPSLEDKSNCAVKLPTKTNEEMPDSLMKKGSSEPVLKRARFETPSPLPTFKVRKEKLGDRITALQQLVSPFGKTDTASVLHEAIDYIKFLHDQVNVLSTPYLKNGNQIQHQGAGDQKLGEQGGEAKKDLRSRGLCLVPISSTFPVANETTADFWTPTFGGVYREKLKKTMRKEKKRGRLMSLHRWTYLAGPASSTIIEGGYQTLITSY